MMKLNMRVIKWGCLLLTAEVCFSNGNQNGSYDCNVRKGELCYFVGSDELQNWSGARRVCQSKNSTLPIIRNREEQEAFVAYFKSLGRSLVLLWTLGKRKTYNGWTWINGQALNTATTISPDSEEKAHIMIEWSQGRYIMKPENPVNDSWYLCQNKDSQCNGQHEVNATYGCLAPSETVAPWYEARRDCLSKGGDLAILTDRDLQILNNRRFQNSMYWIGLRKVYFVWDTTSQEEVTYTNWVRQSGLFSLYGDFCIAVHAQVHIVGKWSVEGCSAWVPTVCERRGETKTSSTVRSTTREATARPTDGISSTFDTGETGIRPTDGISSTSDAGKLAFIIGLSIGITMLAAVVIIVTSILANRKRKLRKSATRNDEDAADNRYQEFHRSDAPANASGNYAALTSGPGILHDNGINETTEQQHYEEIP